MKHKHILIGLGVVLGLAMLIQLGGSVRHQAQASQLSTTWEQVNADGFGDPLNQ